MIAQNPEWQGAAQHYNLPYLLQPHPQRVLVVGAGTGNDVAAAVRNGAGEIDAVEIDPAIQKLGRLMHPEQPYQQPNVHAIVNDARAHLRHTDQKYDLIVYGLLDSHTLLSSLSGVRLDSYIYTVEAFRDARARLKPGGLIYCSFAMFRGEIGRKLYLMLTEAFDGQPPLVIRTTYDGGNAFIIGEKMDRAALAAKVPAGMLDVTSVVAGNDFVADKSTDDWPFFYMPVRAYPRSYAVMVGALLVLAVLFIRGFMSGSSENAGFSWPCFFLGAGFMLLETKAITELALFYGSTWVVVGIVITAILVMAFAANLLIMRLPRINAFIVYGLLLASILGRLGFDRVHVQGQISEQLIVTLLLTLPLFFAGLAFSSELMKARSIGAAMGANLLGAMLGGCLEYNSMYFGYRSLYFLALGLYALALITSILPRRSPDESLATLENRKTVSAADLRG
jgi:SAM-dependent methyltransferase